MPRRPRGATAGSSLAFPAPPDCLVVVAGRDGGGADVAGRRPAAPSPAPAPRPTVYSPRLCQAARSGSCRTPGTTAASLRTEPRTARRDSSPRRNASFPRSGTDRRRVLARIVAILTLRCLPEVGIKCRPQNGQNAQLHAPRFRAFSPFAFLLVIALLVI